ncbi:MAG TPA: undecaprenyldiphospho-muramoylpentapeptide beta-N-acetylglucosaminyltransferase [Actinomycetota bacterium]|nr:undecaprenyldiphospho-muramoylpentapeptide beta-N-acetylglucosaminyltransferase [Actinomycetota bacterium]
MKVVMSGGGTAGHVFPALAVAERLRDRGHDVRFVGSASGQEATLVPGAGFPFVPVRVASAQTRVSLHTAKALWMSFTSASAVRPLVRAADVVVGIGGYASAPAILAARRVRTPIVLIEQNGVPGIVNRVAARWAGAVATTFEATAERLPPGIRVVRTGNPVRRRIAEVVAERVDRRAEALRAFELDTDRRTVSVFGGSQGARQLDRTVAAAIGELRGRHDLQLLVSTGAAHEGEVAPAAEASGDLLVRVEGFIERMDLALAATDLAVARAGSGTISELAVCGVPSLLVPYPHATEHHQEANGREVERAGGAEVVLEAELTPTVLARRVAALIDDEPRRAAMSRAMLAWARPDADERIADLVAEVAA